MEADRYSYPSSADQGAELPTDKYVIPASSPTPL